MTKKQVSIRIIWVLASLLLAGCQSSFMATPTKTPTPILTTTPMATSESILLPSIPGVSGKIAFVRGNHLFVLDLDHSTLTQLTSDDLSNLSWSPDGKKIALIGKCDSFPPNRFLICVINADGSNLKLLGYAVYGKSSFSWSSDSQKVTLWGREWNGYQRNNLPEDFDYSDVRKFVSSEPGLFVVNADGSEPVLLKSSDQLQGLPHTLVPAALSPDWKKIAYVPDDHPYRVYIMNSVGSEQKKIIDINEIGVIVHISWSPDSKKLLLVVDKSDEKGEKKDVEIFVMNADGSGFISLVEFQTSFITYIVVWTPDGKKVAYQEGSGNVNVINIDGTGKTRTGCTIIYHFAWSPDGEKAICLMNRNNLGIVNPDGTDPVELLKYWGGPLIEIFDWTP